MVAKQNADAQRIEANHNFGVALSEKAKAAELGGNRLFARLYALHALSKLSSEKGAEAYQEAVQYALNNSVPLPAFTSRLTQEIVSLAFSPDSHIIASASGKTVTLWNAATGDLLKRLEGHDDRVHGIAFSPDGRFIASASLDKTIRIWDTATNKFLQPLKGHKKSVYNVAFSPDGRYLVSASKDGTIGIWNVADLVPFNSLKDIRMK